MQLPVLGAGWSGGGGGGGGGEEGGEDGAGVDSLNVSVTGGIVLHHLIASLSFS